MNESHHNIGTGFIQGSSLLAVALFFDQLTLMIWHIATSLACLTIVLFGCLDERLLCFARMTTLNYNICMQHFDVKLV
jgi:hypothetical protein